MSHIIDIQTATDRQIDQRIMPILADNQTREALRQPSKRHAMITNVRPLNTRNGITITTGTFHSYCNDSLRFGGGVCNMIRQSKLHTTPNPEPSSL